MKDKDGGRTNIKRKMLADERKRERQDIEIKIGQIQIDREIV